MKITGLSIKNFLTIAEAELSFGQITIVAGPNWSGKTSIQQAIRLALTGEVARVDRKGDYRLLVRDGAKSAAVAAVLGERGVRAATLKAAASGHQVPLDYSIHPALLDMHRLTAMLPKERLATISEILGVMPETEDVAARLLARNVTPEAVEAIKPIIAAGWDSAQRAAEDRAKEARAAWRQLTGETYGSQKAETWEASVTLPDKAEELAAAVERNRERVTLAQKQWDEYEPQVRELEAVIAQAGATFACPDCGTISALVDPEKVKEAAAKLPERQDALGILQRAIDTRRRDLVASEEAQAAIITAGDAAKKLTAEARKAHEAVAEWERVQQLLAPDGLPAELLRPRLTKIQEHLADAAEATGFGLVTVTEAGDVSKEGRPYALLSEAEQWVTDAMLTWALVHESSSGLLMLDRVDVLDLPKRAAALNWLRTVDEQVILFATLKARPSLSWATVYWIEKGQIIQPQEAAA